MKYKIIEFDQHHYWQWLETCPIELLNDSIQKFKRPYIQWVRYEIDEYGYHFALITEGKVSHDEAKDIIDHHLWNEYEEQEDEEACSLYWDNVAFTGKA